MRKIKLIYKTISVSIVLILVLSIVVYSQLSQNRMSVSPITKIITSEYYPVDSSMKLIYDSSFGEALSLTKKKGNDYIIDMRNDDFYFVQTIQVGNDTIYLTRLDEQIDIFLFISGSVEVTYDRPSIRFPFPLAANDTWHWTGVEFIDGENPDTITVAGRVLGEELVKTDIGDFECVKFQIDIHKKKSGAHTKFYEWRTPKIGLVKLEAYIDSKGFIGTIMSLLGYDEMHFILKKIV